MGYNDIVVLLLFLFIFFIVWFIFSHIIHYICPRYSYLGSPGQGFFPSRVFCPPFTLSASAISYLCSYVILCGTACRAFRVWRSGPVSSRRRPLNARSRVWARASSVRPLRAPVNYYRSRRAVVDYFRFFSSDLKWCLTGCVRAYCNRWCGGGVVVGWQRGGGQLWWFYCPPAADGMFFIPPPTRTLYMRKPHCYIILRRGHDLRVSQRRRVEQNKTLT